jgi:hypothetical protein
MYNFRNNGFDNMIVKPGTDIRELSDTNKTNKPMYVCMYF